MPDQGIVINAHRTFSIADRTSCNISAGYCRKADYFLRQGLYEILKKAPLTFILTMLFLAAVNAPQVGYCAEQTPEKFVLEFYAWYFKVDKGAELAEKNGEIYAYVDKTVVEIAKNEAGAEYYFTKMYSYSAAWDTVEVIAGDSVTMSGGVIVVPVTFRLDGENGTSANAQEVCDDYQVIVFIKQENSDFRIIKVVDCYPYS